MLQIKRERKIRPYKKRKRIKEKKIELYKKRRKIKDENFFDNQPQLISLLAPEVIQEKQDYIYMGDDKYARIFVLMFYPSYIGNYLTCLFTVNGKIAYCLQSQKASPPSGSYVAQVLDSNKNLQKVLYYGYGGAGDLTGSYLSGKTEDEKYVYTHIAASYAYAGEAGFTGCNYNDLVNAGVIAYINYLFGQEEPPKGELSLSSTKLNAVRDGNIQKTPNITLSGDHRNYVTLSVPENVTAHNLSKGTSVTNGKIQIYGGDTFYLSADLLLTGSYASGNLYGSVGKTWRTLVLTTGDSKQDIGVFESETAAPVSFSVQWLNMTRIELMKKDVNTQNPLSGAVYGIYTDKKCENLLMTMSATGTDGKAVSDYFDSALKTVYVKEITAPTGYKLNTEVYKVAVTAGKTMTVTATDERVTGKVKIAKIDKETLAFKAQGDSVLRGAVYGLLRFIAIAWPSVLHVYFDLFSGAIQTYVFCMLTMTYVTQACETDE